MFHLGWEICRHFVANFGRFFTNFVEICGIIEVGNLTKGFVFYECGPFKLPNIKCRDLVLNLGFLVPYLDCKNR